MGGPSDAGNHREIIELLPWYLNRTLLEPELKRVEAHLAACSACQRELGELEAVRSAVMSSSQQLEASSPDLFEKLMGCIRSYELERAQAVGVGTRLKNWLAAIAALWSPLPTYARAALVAQLAAITILAGLLATSVQRPDRYGTMAGPQGIEGEAVRINVAFLETASEKEIRDLMVSIKATIVSGPSPLGFYTIAVPIASGVEPQTTLDDALRRLRGRPEVVRFAEGLP